MELYAHTLNFAIPLFLVMIAIEQFAARRLGMSVNRGADMISSLSSGLTNIVKDVLGLSIVIISYGWMVKHLAVYTIESTWLVCLVAFVAKDFAGYWIHRLEHEFNVLWNRHVVHHSSEEYNLSCALRQSISEVFSFFAIFMLPAALLGVPTNVFAIVAPLHLFAQFWYHTRTIGRLGWLEQILVTPSHHRVHHAINPIYIDKNYSQVFIIWDKLFGTFQPELDSEPPVYGVKKPAHTWNPILINFQHLWMLVQDAWHTRRWWDKLRLWVMPTGWRPEDVQQTYPVEIIVDPTTLHKYDTQLSSGLLYWSWVQYSVTGLSALYLFNRLAAIGAPAMFFYGLFVFASVYSLCTLMDKNPRALLYEFLRAAVGCSLIAWQGDWFGLNQFVPWGTAAIAVYFGVSLAMTAWFTATEVKQYVNQHQLAPVAMDG
ncbi:MAG: sterol desaturase family protein [Pirellulaceae bacterium]|nr:sterol desaturase family protein [Pirellulaceae bacterium]